jgi:hypothetical protein
MPTVANVIFWGIIKESSSRNGLLFICFSTCYFFLLGKGDTCERCRMQRIPEMEFTGVIWWKSKAFDSRLFTAANFSHKYQVPLIQVLDFFPTVEMESQNDLQKSIEIRRKGWKEDLITFFPFKKSTESYFAFIKSRHPNAVAVGVNSWRTDRAL